MEFEINAYYTATEDEMESDLLSTEAYLQIVNALSSLGLDTIDIRKA